MGKNRLDFLLDCFEYIYIGDLEARANDSATGG